jgi:hypothetical protein
MIPYVKNLLFIIFLLINGNTYSQNYVDRQVDLAREIKIKTEEAVKASEAHTKDMEEMGTRVWRNAFEKIWDATERCKNINKNYHHKKFIPELKQILQTHTLKTQEDLRFNYNSITRKSDILKSTKERTCYPGFESNLNAYIDCQKSYFRYMEALNAAWGADIMLTQFGIIKKKSDEYLTCSEDSQRVIDDDVKMVLETIEKASDFYISTSARFESQADRSLR